MAKKSCKIRKSTALSFERKHTCRHCSYKSFTIVHMHEQTCELNPNRALNIAKRYGPNHLTGSDISKLIEASKKRDTIARVYQVSELARAVTESVLLVLEFTVTPDLPVLSQNYLDSVFGAL